MKNNVPVSFYKGKNPETGKNGYWGVEVTFNFFSSMISPTLTMGIIIGYNSKEPKEEHLLFQYFLQWINGKILPFLKLFLGIGTYEKLNYSHKNRITDFGILNKIGFRGRLNREKWGFP